MTAAITNASRPPVSAPTTTPMRPPAPEALFLRPQPWQRRLKRH
ncbi:hypothetical protein [Nonomuraea angiospora]|nr:hypothetical protein [Nonomuraea angiospora]MDX3106238.1 hypothetical protein [Nonomuraea angiospora]